MAGAGTTLTGATLMEETWWLSITMTAALIAAIQEVPGQVARLVAYVKPAPDHLAAVAWQVALAEIHAVAEVQQLTARALRLMVAQPITGDQEVLMVRQVLAAAVQR